MSTLIITRGLPGSGKTTRAKAWVAQDPAHRARVGMDEIEAMLGIPTDCPVGACYLRNMDPRMVAAVRGAVRSLLRTGFDVVLDHPHLLPQFVDEAQRLAVRSGADFEVWNMMDVPVGICVERDAQRGLDGGHAVGAKRICELYEIYQRHRRYDPDQVRPAGGVFDRMVTNITDKDAELLMREPAPLPIVVPVTIEEGRPCTCRAATEGGGHSHGCHYWPNPEGRSHMSTDDQSKPFADEVDPWPEGEALRSEVVDAETMAVLPPWLSDKIERAMADPSTWTRRPRPVPHKEENENGEV